MVLRHGVRSHRSVASSDRWGFGRQLVHNDPQLSRFPPHATCPKGQSLRQPVISAQALRPAISQ
jgi:hypothetical protein